MNEQEILKQAWICSCVVDNSKAASVFTMGEREVLKFAHVIEREALQRAVEICEWMADELQSSDCSDCAEAIKKEMEGIGDE